MSGLTARIHDAVDAALSAKGSVAPLDVVARLGWIRRGHDDVWRRGNAPSLEEALAFPPDKLAHAVALIDAACRARRLEPLDATPTYLAGTRERAPLRFTRAGADDVERAWRTHWLAPDASEKRRAAIASRLAKPADLVVHVSLRAQPCSECGDALDAGALVVVERDEAVCRDCVGYGHLVFLPSGDTALTRRAKAESALSVVVLRFSRARKRSERQGLLVEEAALERAEARCFADAEARERQRARGAERRAREDVALVAKMAARIAALFPRAPAAEAEAIARHAAERSSGRVGRSAAGRALQDDAVRLAVVAHVRHVHTPYDALLAQGVDRRDARDRIRGDVERVLTAWRGGS